MDLTGAEAALKRFRRHVKSPVLAISGVSGKGLSQLLEHIWLALAELKKAETAPAVKPRRIGPHKTAAAQETDADQEEDDGN